MRSIAIFFTCIMSSIVFSGCTTNTPPTISNINQSEAQQTQQVQNTNSDAKFYCESSDDCIDGEYCEVTEPGGCVGSAWWWDNVGYKYNCLPEPDICTCVNNRCQKK